MHIYQPVKMEQTVTKRRHTKFRRRGITQKKTYNKSMVIQGVGYMEDKEAYIV
jgi:hypothetical protein